MRDASRVGLVLESVKEASDLGIVRIVLRMPVLIVAEEIGTRRVEVQRVAVVPGTTNLDGGQGTLLGNAA